MDFEPFELIRMAPYVASLALEPTVVCMMIIFLLWFGMTVLGSLFL